MTDYSATTISGDKQGILRSFNSMVAAVDRVRQHLCLS